MVCTLNQRLFNVSLSHKAPAGHQFIISIFVAHESLLLGVNVPHFNEIVLLISSPRVLRDEILSHRAVEVIPAPPEKANSCAIVAGAWENVPERIDARVCCSERLCVLSDAIVMLISACTLLNLMLTSFFSGYMFPPLFDHLVGKKCSAELRCEIH